MVEGNNIVLTKNITEHASTQQQKQITVKGVVTDMRGEPIIGASVVEKVRRMVQSPIWTVTLL